MHEKRRTLLDVSTSTASEIACTKFWAVRLLLLVILGTLCGEFIYGNLLPTRQSLESTISDIQAQTQQNSARIKNLEQQNPGAGSATPSTH